MVAFRGLGAQTFTENLPVVQDSQVVFITVKPWIVPLVLDSVKSISGGKLFISVAMGLKLADLEQSLVPEARVIRVMPNIPTLVRAGAAVFVRGEKATEQDCTLTQTLFESVGTCDEVTEALIDPITALSGSGPGYVFAMIEAMADGAVKMGLSRDLAYKLAAQTVMGAGKMVRETGIHPGQLKDDVASPGGSTIHGLSFLEKNGKNNSSNTTTLQLKPPPAFQRSATSWPVPSRRPPTGVGSFPRRNDPNQRTLTAAPLELIK